jgi:hypothetical protein
MTHFWRPLSNYGKLADYASDQPFVSAKPTRIVLITGNLLGDDKDSKSDLPRLMARFPQARWWRRVFISMPDLSEVWVSDLSPSQAP